jgi:hypothetical protein
MKIMQSSKGIASLSILALVGASLAGCAVEAEDPSDGETGEAHEALTCSGSGCNGVNPYATSCVLDQVNKGSGTILVNGHSIGTVTLYYSPTCQAAWGYTGLTGTHGSFSVCVENWTTGAAQCGTGGAQTASQVSPMIYVPIGQTVYAEDSVQANGDVYGALTPFFTRH